MKARSAISCLALSLCLSTPLFADNVEVGDSFAVMVEKLGQPQGSVDLNDKVIYLYAEGSVTVADERVLTVNIRTADEMAREAEVRQEQAEQAKAHQERIQNKGETLKANKLTDPEFLAKSSGEQLAFWRNFTHHFPDVDVSAIIAPLAERYAKEQAELASVENIIQAQQDRITQLEQQLQRAQAQIQELENRPTYYANYGTSYPAYYPYPQSKVIIVNTGDKHKPHKPHSKPQGNSFKVGGVTITTPTVQQQSSTSNVQINSGQSGQ